MLELQKKQIHMSRSKNTVSAQVTFDEDFNIPDAKPDVGSVLLKQADAVMEELRQLSEKVIIKGRLDFEILYAVEGSGRMKNLSGALTFEENVSYPGLEPGDYVRCRTKVEDISIRVVNSRKLHISAVLGACEHCCISISRRGSKIAFRKRRYRCTWKRYGSGVFAAAKKGYVSYGG